MSALAWRALHDGLGLGTVVIRAGELKLRDGVMPAEDKAPPDYQLYKQINGL